MNIFNKYGIKEIADVTFYSINRIGDEEFYTPVLFFDTLKVSTLEKSVETVNSSGGKGNGKIISWNFNKDAKLKLQDALFSEVSMNVYMNGQMQARLSNWTSAIAKLRVANKYGCLHYSTKAKPSPELTAAEWDIVFRCAEKAGYNAKYGNFISKAFDSEKAYLYDYGFENKLDSEKDRHTNAYVAENRKFLVEKYKKRTQPTPLSRDIASFFIFPKTRNYSDLNIEIIGFRNLDEEKENAKLYKDNELGDKTLSLDIKISGKMNKEQFFEHDGVLNISFNNESIVKPQVLTMISIVENGYDTPIVCGDYFLYSHIPFYIFPNYLSTALGENFCFCDMQDKKFLAMPEKVINEIIKEVDSIKKIGTITNDLYDSTYIDRFEKCVVTKYNGFEIDAEQQRKNLIRYYSNDFSSNYTIYYDAKTMLPLFNSEDNGDFNIKSYNDMAVIVNSNIDSISSRANVIRAIEADIKSKYGEEKRELNEITNIKRISDTKSIVFYTLKNPNIFKIKKGTVYYKWTRTVDNSDNLFTSIGTDLKIDIDTFPDEYKIVGETYIREQKTGKDQRYQFVIKRAEISPSTNIELKADGNPTTFSMDINVLMPKDKIMLELRQFDVEEDKQQGGFKIVPQSKKYSYTPTNQEYTQSVIDNNEIY